MEKKLIICNLTSKFHVAGAMSFIDNMIYDVDKIDFIFIVNYHKPSKDFRISNKEFNSIKRKKIIYKTEGQNNIDLINQNTKLDNYTSVILMNVMQYDFRLLYYLKFNRKIQNIELVNIDEGLGTYFGSKNFKKSVANENTYHNIRKKESYIQPIKDIIKPFYKRVSEFIFRKFLLNSTKFHLFEIVNNKLESNKNVVVCYRNYYKKELKNDFKYISNTSNIIIISNNLGLNLVNLHDETVVYQTVIDKLLELYPKANIYLKPHPQEVSNLSKFDQLKECTILTEKISAEEIFVNSENVELVVGLTSTSLLTAAVVFEEKVYSFIDVLENFEITNLTKEQLSLFNLRVSNIKNIKTKL